MRGVSLQYESDAGPTKPEVRAVVLAKLEPGPTDHVVDVGSCTGAMTIEAAGVADRVTALERDPQRAEITRKNVAANGVESAVELREAEAPNGLPDDADAMFLGGSRNFEGVLDHAVETDVDRIVMNVSRLEVAGRSVDAFRERGLLEEVLQLQVSHGYDLDGATSFDADNPVYVIVGKGENG